MISAAREQADKLLAGFAKSIGLEGFALDEAGTAQLAFDEVFMNMELDDEKGSLVLTAPLGAPGEAGGDVYARLLDANMFWAGTAGGTVARESGTGSIVLLRALPLNSLDEPGFEAAVQAFVDAAENLATQVAAPAPETPSSELSPDTHGFIRV